MPKPLPFGSKQTSSDDEYLKEKKESWDFVQKKKYRYEVDNERFVVIITTNVI